MNPMRTVSFKLPPELDEALTELAARRNASRSSLVREALLAYTAKKVASVTDLVDQLLPPDEGPADLSTNKKYLRDYGA
jgi:predicted transcriptional regulator